MRYQTKINFLCKSSFNSTYLPFLFLVIRDCQMIFRPTPLMNVVAFLQFLMLAFDSWPVHSLLLHGSCAAGARPIGDVVTLKKCKQRHVRFATRNAIARRPAMTKLSKPVSIVENVVAAPVSRPFAILSSSFHVDWAENVVAQIDFRWHVTRL